MGFEGVYEDTGRSVVGEAIYKRYQINTHSETCDGQTPQAAIKMA